MFDMGFTELMLIGIVALVVIGPERLPGVARTAGKYFGKVRRFMVNVRADVESELRADELRQMLEKQSEELQSLKDVVNDAGKNLSAEMEMQEIAKSIDNAMPKFGGETQSTEDTDTEIKKDWSSDIVAPASSSNGDDQDQAETITESMPLEQEIAHEPKKTPNE